MYPHTPVDGDRGVASPSDDGWRGSSSAVYQHHHHHHHHHQQHPQHLLQQQQLSHTQPPQQEEREGRDAPLLQQYGGSLAERVSGVSTVDSGCSPRTHEVFPVSFEVMMRLHERVLSLPLLNPPIDWMETYYGECVNAVG